MAHVNGDLAATALIGYFSSVKRDDDGTVIPSNIELLEAVV